MLSIKNASIAVNNNKILHSITMDIKEGDIVAIMGQNGQGKSSLLKSIMGHYEYRIEEGHIFYNEEEISNMPVNEISKLGIFLANQNPVEIPGISMLDFFKTIYEEKYKITNILNFYKNVNSALKVVNLNEDFLTRSINEKFSGGEKKKSEMAQMLLLNPNFIMLDEIDSGLDIDSAKTIFKILEEQKNLGKTIVFVSHHSEMINHLKPNKVILLANKTIVKIGDNDLANEIISIGYKKYLTKIGIKNESKQVVGVCQGKKNAK
ncbi:MAG: Fe-S cluster assembly ATPase SufC [Mycoplasma sp.]